MVRTGDPMPARSSSVCLSSVPPHLCVAHHLSHTGWSHCVFHFTQRGGLGHREDKCSMDAESPVPYQLLPAFPSISSQASSRPFLSVSGVCTLGVIEVEREVPRGHSWTVPRGAVHAGERDSLEECESERS